MTASFQAPISACPACAVVPSAEAQAERATASANVILSLPGVHCAVCISTVERGLAAMPGVTSARVNLTLKRVAVKANPDVTPQSLITRLAALGYEAHELDAGILMAMQTDAQGRDLLMRLAVAFFAMMNIMLLSVAVWSGADDATRDMFHWISAFIALPAVAFSGQPFFKSAWRALRAGRLAMEVPISLALILASAISVYETTQNGHQAYFDAAVMLTFFLLAGRFLDHRTRAIARSAAQELAALEVPRAIRVQGPNKSSVAIADLVVGDLVLVRPGGRMPVDGVVVQGSSEIDRSLLTGESLPAWAGADTVVSAGEINLTGPLIVRVTAAGRDSSLHRMAELVAMAETARNRYTSLADRAARIYSPGVHLLSFTAFGVWMYLTGGDFRFAINISAAVLIITCPCALGLAVPAVVTAASGKLFRKGLLIKDGTALERLAEVDTVVFDKTGTLTLGMPEPTNLQSHAPKDLAIAYTLAAASSHPLAQALAKSIAGMGISQVPISNLREVPGYGIEGVWKGKSVRLGRAAWLNATPLDVTATYLAIGNDPTRTFSFADGLRPGAAQVVAALTAQGKSVHLISGDVPGAVSALASRLGITNWTAEALPAQKAQAVIAMTAAGHRVLMVGDGLNDTAALTAAHVSISPAQALDVARVASDIVLLGTDISPIAEAIRIAVKARRRIKENFAISTSYNVIAVPLALVGLATPLAAAAAMSVSSITVSLNALRLK
jgi:P-type Cu2+ transporter